MPVLATLAGTWIGFGQPGGTGALAAGRRVVHVLAGSASPRGAGYDPPPPVEASPSVEPEAPADPNEWPRLNPDASTERAWVLAEGPAYAPTDQRRFVTLTFDDGPFPETTPFVLDMLAAHHIRAAFFMIGRYLDGDDPRAARTRAVAQQVLAAGHIVGNHTHDHVELPGVSRARALAQIDDGAASIEHAVGQRPVFFRPPYGQLDPFLEGASRERGLEIVLWSVAADDMERTDPQEIADAIIERIDYADGGIVLLHDMHWPSVKALKRVLRWLGHHRYDPDKPEVRGYEIVDLYQYLRATAASPQPYGTREELEAARKRAHSS